MKKFIKNILQKWGYDTVPRFTIGVTVRQLRNILYYQHCYSLIASKDGAVVECGVGKGRSLLYFSFFATEEKKNRKIWGFDSFEGFPEPVKEDTSYRAPKKGEWSGISAQDIRDTLKVAGISKSFIDTQVKLVPGFFEKTLSQYDGKPIALLHIDADLYESYKIVLEILYPKVISGGIVLFDEYDTPEWPGATKAVNDFFGNDSKRIQKDALSGKHYIVKQ